MTTTTTDTINPFPQGMSIHSDADLKCAARACGSHYFDPDTMRFFRSRVAPGVRVKADGRVVFITSEQFRHSNGHEPRKYTVRVATFTTHKRDDGMTVWDMDVQSPFQFQHAETLRQARVQARTI